MKTKIQKLFTILLALPIAFGIFAGVAQAADCADLDDCKVAFRQKILDLDVARELHMNFAKCYSGCSDWFFIDWDLCHVLVSGVNNQGEQISRDCWEVYDLTSDSIDGPIVEPSDMMDWLKSEETRIGGEATSLNRQVQNFKTVEANEILSIEDQENSENSLNASTFMDKVIDLLVKMVGLVAFTFLVVGGFRLVAAAGNDNEIQKAKTMIIYSIIGLVIVLLAYIIVATVQGLLYK